MDIPVEYAFQTDVPLNVLTDGRTRNLYVPAEPGSYEGCRVYKLDLCELPPAETADNCRNQPTS